MSVCLHTRVCASVCVSCLPIPFFFSPTHQAPEVWWAVISGCLCADGGGLEEGVKSADGRSESFKRCFKTHHGPFDGGEYGQWKYLQNDTCEMGDWVNTESCLMWGSQGNNCRRKRCGRMQWETRLCSPSWNFKQASMFKIWVLKRAITSK